MKSPRSLLLLLLLSPFLPSVEAAPVLSNLDGDSLWYSVIADDGATYPFLGQSFIAGPTASGQWSLNFITLGLYDAEDGTTGTFHVSIYKNSGGKPSAVLQTLDGPTQPVSAGNYSYLVDEPLYLTAGEQYWIVASVVNSPSPGSGYTWNIIDEYTLNQGGWSVDASVAVAFGEPGDWQVWSADFNDGIMAFSIDATAVVPEPGTLALLGLSVLAFLVRRRKAAAITLG